MPKVSNPVAMFKRHIGRYTAENVKLSMKGRIILNAMYPNHRKINTNCATLEWWKTARTRMRKSREENRAHGTRRQAHTLPTVAQISYETTVMNIGPVGYLDIMLASSKIEDAPSKRMEEIRKIKVVTLCARMCDHWLATRLRSVQNAAYLENM